MSNKNKKVFKEGDSVFVHILLKGKVNIFGVVLRQPQFITLEGRVASIYKPSRVNYELLSIEIPKWPLRYVANPEDCYETKEDSEKAMAEKNANLPHR